jgi:SHO1 osmosensor
LFLSLDRKYLVFAVPKIMGVTLSNFTGDPFAISTVSFGVISWIVAIAGGGASIQSEFPRLSWWTLVYEILVILLIFWLYINGNIELYKFALVGFVSVAFVLTTNSTNQLIYNTQSSANLACAAGCILLSILNVIWIGYFGGHPESPTNQFIDSFSLKSNNHHLSDSHEKSADEDFEYKRYAAPSANIPFSQSQTLFQENNVRQSQLTNMNPAQAQKNTASSSQGYMSSSQLNGLENFSNNDLNQTNNQQHNENTLSSIPFRYKAKALYSYDANPDDVNEISFAKDEILEVDDIDGKWWQARKSNGQIGICPSNYVKLLD